jgi:hypothetical protein
MRKTSDFITLAKSIKLKAESKKAAKDKSGSFLND